MTDRCAKLRNRKRCLCNSVSFSLSGSLWQSSDVQFGFFLSRFHHFYQEDFIWALAVFSSYLFIFETYIYIYIYILIGENRPIDVGEIE